MWGSALEQKKMVGVVKVFWDRVGLLIVAYELEIHVLAHLMVQKQAEQSWVSAYTEAQATGLVIADRSLN